LYRLLDERQHGDANEQRQHGKGVFGHGLGLRFDFVVHTRDLIAAIRSDLHNVKFGMADHSAINDAAARAAQAGNASVVAKWFEHGLGLRLKRTKIENLDQLILVAADSDRQHAVTLESLKRKLARDAKVSAKMEAVRLDSIMRLDVHCVGHVVFLSFRC
jgi:hypothetical protein